MKTRKIYKPKKSCVYVATNLINEKRYVGVTCRYLCRRKYHHFRSARLGSQAAFHRAIRKYGKEAFIFTVAGWYVSYDDAKTAEVKIIGALKPEYNMTVGGDGSVGYQHTDAKKRQMSERMKGKPGPWRGKGQPPGFAKPKTAESRKKIGDSRRGKPMTMEQVSFLLRDKEMAANYGGIVCLNDGKAYPSGAAAARACDLNESQVNAVCKRSLKQKTAGGLVFRFFGDHHGGPAEAERIVNEIKEQKKRNAPRYMKAVIRTADNMLFETITGAAIGSGVCNDVVLRSCKNRYRYNSVYKDQFCYLNEWCPNPL